MLSRQVRVISRRLCPQFTCFHKQEYANVAGYHERDPAPFFFDKSIQDALKRVTRPEIGRVFRVRKLGQKIRRPIHKFMTEEELKAHTARVEKRAEYEILQMPPVVAPRKDISQIYSEDPALQGYIDNKIVFTDISFGMPSRKRLIAVREPNGTLRAANWEERDRMNQIYAPMEYRELETPKMFQGEHLESLLDRKEYEFILDRACIQFEPDDPMYHTVVEKVYSIVNSNKEFDYLRSTRHFGPMVFYLIWEKNLCILLRDLIASDHIDEAALIAKIYYKIYPTEDPITKQAITTGGIDLVECFCNKEFAWDHPTQLMLEEYKVLHPPNDAPQSQL